MRVALLQDGTLRDVDVEAPASVLTIDGTTYERHEIRNSINNSTKGYVYATKFPHGDVLAHIQELITGRRYGENCPICGVSVDIADDVMPWIVIEGVPHIAHTRCVGAYRAEHDAAEESRSANG